MIRFFDFIISFSLIILISPFFLIISLLIYFLYSKPIFFIQKRVTIDRLFYFFKFRTMHHVKNVNQGDNENYLTMDLVELRKIRNQYRTTNASDNRITKFGKFLRKTSLDEIPQLFSVLFGDMSLVGPRPDPPIQRADYDQKSWLKRCSVKSGITGLAQINGRSEGGIENRIKNDLYWVDNKSLKLYLKILFKTPFVLFKSVY